MTNSAPGVATATIDAATGRLQLTPGSGTGTTTVTVTARVAGQPDVTDSFVVTVLPGRAIRFGPSTVLGSLLFPAIADIDGDGRVELAGTRNVGGQLVQQDLRAIGLGPIVDRFAAADNRENRLADLNGDGRLDLVTWTYTPVSDATGIARLFLGRPDGTYVEDPAFAALDIRGFGHTIAAADFDNDGDVDLFLVEYTHNDPREQFFLLLNDGAGHFTDVADAAGVANRGWPEYAKSEGVQAVDVDGDGDIDLYAASHFYFNQGVDRRCPALRRSPGRARPAGALRRGPEVLRRRQRRAARPAAAPSERRTAAVARHRRRLRPVAAAGRTSTTAATGPTSPTSTAMASRT